jgi:hypothetical protein
MECPFSRIVVQRAICFRTKRQLADSIFLSFQPLKGYQLHHGRYDRDLARKTSTASISHRGCPGGARQYFL